MTKFLCGICMSFHILHSSGIVVAHSIGGTVMRWHSTGGTAVVAQQWWHSTGGTAVWWHSSGGRFLQILQIQINHIVLPLLLNRAISHDCSGLTIQSYS